MTTGGNMAIRPLEIIVNLTRDQFVYIVLLNGNLDVKSSEGDEMVIGGAQDHRKYGPAGTEDGSYHFFRTYITYQGHDLFARANFASHDDGKTYRGILFVNM